MKALGLTVLKTVNSPKENTNVLNHVTHTHTHTQRNEKEEGKLVHRVSVLIHTKKTADESQRGQVTCLGSHS